MNIQNKPNSPKKGVIIAIVVGVATYGAWLFPKTQQAQVVQPASPPVVINNLNGSGNVNSGSDSTQNAASDSSSIDQGVAKTSNESPQAPPVQRSSAQKQWKVSGTIKKAPAIPRTQIVSKQCPISDEEISAQIINSWRGGFRNDVPIDSATVISHLAYAPDLKEYPVVVRVTWSGPVTGSILGAQEQTMRGYVRYVGNSWQVMKGS